MSPHSRPSPTPPVRQQLDRTVARQFFMVATWVCLCAAASLSLQELHLSAAMKHTLVGACLGVAALFGLASWKAHSVSAKWSVLGTAWAGCALVTLVTIGSGFGIQSHDLAFFGLLICLVAVLAGVRHALGMTVVAAAVITGLAVAEYEGWLQGGATVARAPLSDPVISQVLLLVAGLAVGLIVSRVARLSLAAYAEREERFRALLHMAVDHYWELDADLRFVQADPSARSVQGAPQGTRLGLRPWETVDRVGLAPDQQQQHFDDLIAHRPFARLRTCVRNAGGAPKYLDVSGQPRFDAQGVFLGYWGVARDVSDEVAAEQARRRSETMLSSLLDSSPDCITLTDLSSGRYLMVNQSNVRVTGYSVEEVVGRTSIELGIWHSQAERERLVEAVRTRGEVSGMRCVFVTKSGSRVTMLVSASRCIVDAQECLVINARDVTEDERARLEYAAILQRASIGIAFTRERVFASANPCFERMFGWECGSLAGQSGKVVWPADTDYAEIGRLAGPLLELGQPVELERPMKRKDGSLFWCRLLAQALDPTDARHGGTIWIAEDVTERHQAANALATAKEAAEAASRAKSAFLANTSHEIRTPLNGLLGMARLAIQAGADEPRRQQYLHHILESAQNLAGIISDILDLSKVEAGRIDLEQTPFDLREMLVSIHQAYQSIAAAKSLSLTLALDPDVPANVTGDPTRVRQILSNFITNALKFTDRGEVRIEAQRVGPDRVRLAVVDTGPGIAPEVQPRLFMPFSQADVSTTRRFGGTGLGLSICRELAGLMGGEVGLRSAPGAGSTFWAELPLPTALKSAPLQDAEVDNVSRLRGARVLIAEDNAVNMLITVALLEQWGMAVTQAGDGSAAIDEVRRAAHSGRPFHIVLMDMHMPRMSGYAAARVLRQEFGARELPIIALTAAALVSERDEALQAGMCDFLTKPIDADRMRRTLARHVAAVQALVTAS